MFELALTVKDVKRINEQGKIASLIGVEGGHSIENSINVLRQLYREGARYMTLTHSMSLDWADSCSDDSISGGLSPFGEEIIHEMNRLGMLVDLSHVSAACMRATLKIARAPVIFSHSSARGIADHPRNVPDDVLSLTKQNGGVVMVNFYSDYVNPLDAARSLKRTRRREELKKLYPDDSEKADSELRQWELKNPRSKRCTVHDLLDHIDHIVDIAGIDHVGLGSDFDGVSALPRQLEDVSTYPVITQGLLDRGYTESSGRFWVQISCGYFSRQKSFPPFVIAKVEWISGIEQINTVGAPTVVSFRLSLGLEVLHVRRFPALILQSFAIHIFAVLKTD